MQEAIFNVILHVLLMAVAIALFYFVYVPSVEKHVVGTTVDHVMDSIADDVHDAVSKEELDAFVLPLVGKYLVPDKAALAAADTKAAAHNAQIRSQALKAISLFAAVCVLILLFMVYRYHGSINFGHVIMENAIVIGTVMFTYFLFVRLVIQNYETVDPNMIKKTIVETVKQFATGTTNE
jgi:hypothetical protein